MRISPSSPPTNPFAEGSPLRPVFDTLAHRDPLPPLVVGYGEAWNRDIAQTLHAAQKDNAAPDTVLAALHLMNDDLEAAHVLCQNDPSQTGSYLHYLVHRREGDWSNTRYWAARTGKHPIFAVLARTFLDANARYDEWSAGTLVSEMEQAAKLPQTDGDYQSAAKLSACEMAEAAVWCAQAGAVQ